MIRIENLSVVFGDTEAVKNVSLDLVDGEILGIVGESGSGKSVTALTLMGLVADSARITTGRILFDDVVLQEAGKKRDGALYRSYQGKQMSMVFQEPMTSLNPTQRAGRQVEEMLRLHTKLSAKVIKEKVLETFEAVGLRDVQKVYDSYPHQLSGGMRQRVMIAMAVILNPRLIVADEPTTALDVTIQKQIVDLLREINQKQNNAMLFITHDLNLARKLCHRIAVMKDGRVVEQGDTEAIFGNPREEYTKRLIEAVPDRVKRKSATRKSREDLVKDMQKNPPQNLSNNLAENLQETLSTKSLEDLLVNQQEILSMNSSKNIDPIVQVHNLSVYYRDGGNNRSWIGKLIHAGKKASAEKNTSSGKSVDVQEKLSQKKGQCAVAEADFVVYPGESLGLVGESGCGKTSLSKAILGMNPDIEGEIIHSSIRPQMIFQDPYSSLNPTKTIGWLLQEPLRCAGALDKSKAMSKADMEAAAYDMLRRVGMEEKYFHRRPAQLSGGQRQRVSIAQALITKPGFLVADEPVSALDVTIQAQIMELMQRLQEEMHLAYLFISHDINVIYRMCDRIMVMKEGRIIEIGETEEVFNHPKEEYTKLLLSSS